MIPSGKIQPAVITTESFVGELWVEVLLLPTGMVCPQVGHRQAISAVDRTKTAIFKPRTAYCAGLSLPDTNQDYLKTYSFEGILLIPW
jgi:hypothetical protein